MMKKRFWIGFALFVMLFGTTAAVAPVATPEVYFQMKDALGDDNGPGTYQYPSNIAFKPYKGILDITEFKVWSEQPDEIYFDTTFADNANPWIAPEGFIHQNLRIMVDAIPGQGLTELPSPGANVRFQPESGWDFALRICGWGNSQLLVPQNQKIGHHPLKTQILGDNRTIRAVLPISVAGKPARNWHYYVFVGSFDGFGADFFRKVVPQPGEWVIGGGRGQTLEPLVMDLLASNSASQTSQLRSLDPAKGGMAMLAPVGNDLQGSGWPGWLLGLVLILGIGIASFFLCRWLKQRGNFSWFWIKNRKKAEKGA